MIRTFLHFDIAEGMADGLVGFFDRTNMLRDAVAQDGCHSAELTVSADGRSAVVTAVWTDAAAYDRWTGRDDRGDLGAELSSYLDGEIDASHVSAPMRIALTGDS